MSDLEIRKQIACYLDGEINASELEAWVSEESWDLEDKPSATRKLANDVLRLTSEAANGDWTDEQLRERLGALSRTYWFESAPKTKLSGSEGVFIRHGQPLAGTERPHVAEPA
jgi:hypothetical protein